MYSRAPATEIWPSLPPIDPVATQSFRMRASLCLWHSETGGESFDVRRSYELVSPLVLCAPLCADVTAPGTSTARRTWLQRAPHAAWRGAPVCSGQAAAPRGGTARLSYSLSPVRCSVW